MKIDKAILFTTFVSVFFNISAQIEIPINTFTDDNYIETPWLDRYYYMQLNVLNKDTVRFVEFSEDGDYSRICVEKENTTRCFLNDIVSNDSIQSNDILEIEWSVVLNHAIDDITDTYYDMAIKKISKLIK